MANPIIEIRVGDDDCPTCRHHRDKWIPDVPYPEATHPAEAIVVAMNRCVLDGVERRFGSWSFQCVHVPGLVDVMTDKGYKKVFVPGRQVEVRRTKWDDAQEQALKGDVPMAKQAPKPRAGRL